MREAVRRAMDGLVGLLLIERDEDYRDAIYDAIDRMKEQQRWVDGICLWANSRKCREFTDLSPDLTAAYVAGYERGKEDARKAVGDV